MSAEPLHGLMPSGPGGSLSRPLRDRLTRFVLLLALVPIAVEIGCADTSGPGVILSVSLSPADSTLFAGDSLRVDVSVEYESGPNVPESVTWGVWDPAVLAVRALTDGGAMVTGMENGRAYVIATVDETGVDSAAVEVRPGDVRWIADVGGGSLNHTALDSSQRIYVVNADGPGPLLNGMLHGLMADGTSLYAEPTCYSF